MIEGTPIFDRVAAMLPHPLSGHGRHCTWCGKTRRARVHRQETRP